MGIFGVGNTGAAVTKLVAPTIVVAYGWAMVPQVYAVLMLVTAIAVLVLHLHRRGARRPARRTVTVREQLQVLKDPTVWRYSQYYSIVFGGYVALSLWMTKYYISEYGFDIQLAALLAAGFSIPGGVLRAIGGWFSDKYGAHTVTWWVLWVGAGLPVLPVLSADRLHHPHGDRSQDLSYRARPDGLHRHHVHDGHRLRDRQGLGVQVHLRRLPAQHRRRLRRGRPRRRHGRLHPADHVRRAGGPDRRALLGLHADVRHRLGVADVDVLHRGAADERGAGQQASRNPRTSPETGITHEHASRRTGGRRRRSPTSPTGARGRGVLGIARASASPTATCGSRCPRCCAASRSGACGASSPCRCSTWVSRSPRPSCSR